MAIEVCERTVGKGGLTGDCESACTCCWEDFEEKISASQRRPLQRAANVQSSYAQRGRNLTAVP